MAKDIRERLAATATRRAETAAELARIEHEEDTLIVEAWRAHVPPTEIARLVQRSTAHVRRLRPDDVPPARLGGMAAVGRRRQAKKPPRRAAN
jgi:hypothetical protein